MTLTFRAKTSADVPTLFDIWLGAVEATHAFLLPEDQAAIADLVKDHYLPNAALTVGVAEGALVGFMGLTGTEVDSLFLDPRYHCCGYGTAFIREAEKVGEPLTVEVNEQNSGARAFYEATGFKIIDRKPVDGQGRPYPLLVMKQTEPA